MWWLLACALAHVHSGRAHEAGLRLEVIDEAPVTDAVEVPAGASSGPEGGSCKILSGGYAYMIQALLAITTVSLLIFKWSREQPRRDFTVFLLDGSKQLVGAGWAHAFNLVVAMLLNKYLKAGDECSWYWVNIVVDTTLGTLLCYGLLKLSTRYGGYESGNYMTADGSLDVKKWIPQVVTWCVIVAVMKVCAALLIVLAQTPLDAVASGMLRALSDRWKLLVVMVITPGIMNAFQFWVQDSFLMWRGGTKSEDEAGQSGQTEPLNFTAEGRSSITN